MLLLLLFQCSKNQTHTKSIKDNVWKEQRKFIFNFDRMKKPITIRLISVGISLLICFLLACSHTNKLTCEKLRNSYFDIRRNLHNRHDSLQFINSLETLLANDPDCLKALQLKGSFNLVFNHLSIASHVAQTGF